jgi:hypothetical protein
MDRTCHASPRQQFGVGGIDHSVDIWLAGDIALYAFDLKMLILHNNHEPKPPVSIKQ